MKKVISKFFWKKFNEKNLFEAFFEKNSMKNNKKLMKKKNEKLELEDYENE